jgi:hypothetical protein
MQVISLCLSDLPKEKITTAANGKKYISIVVDSRKEPDKFGNDLTVAINQSKEERAAKQPKKYVGSGKTYTFGADNKPAQTSKAPEPIKEADPFADFIQDDLPY